MSAPKGSPKGQSSKTAKGNAAPEPTPTKVPQLTDNQIEAELTKNPEWSQIGDMIQRTYQFADFIAAMKFVDRVAVAAEKAQHHPDILIRYSRVTLSMTTHDANGISHKDFALAAECDKFASK